MAEGISAGKEVSSGVLRGPGALRDVDMDIGMSSQRWETMGVMSRLDQEQGTSS
jgi:hypothetical protein